jgi:hypothetical protein
MLLFFLPAVVQVLIGVVILVVGLALVHSTILAGIGVAGVAVGGIRTWRRQVPRTVRHTK